MIPASLPVQRPREARLLAVDSRGCMRHLPRSGFMELLRPGDLVVANDAATLPASLSGQHERTGEPIELRLAGRRSLAPDGIRCCTAIAFGRGDFRMRTEDRPLPPVLVAGDRLLLGPLRATIEAILNHPRLVRLAFDGSSRQIWEGLARHGRPIQYSHVTTPLELWDVWTAIAGSPVAFEAPSAGFALDWNTLQNLNARAIRFTAITHAAGISSTGDPGLDALLPFDEPYRISPTTAAEINEARQRHGRIIAIGTTVVRALEHAAKREGSVQPGGGLAIGRLGSATSLHVVDAILSGVHEPGTSHYELLRAFRDDESLRHMDWELNTGGYRTHEYGDSIFVEKMTETNSARWQPAAA